MNPNNAALIEEVNQAGAWFTAQKTKSLWARRIEAAQTVVSKEGDLQANPGDYLCKGPSGELWVQSEKNLRSKYTETAHVHQDADGTSWNEHAPRPDGAGVLAAAIAHPFVVHTSWGLLSGKPGDYLLKRAEDRDNPFPDDVWTVDRQIFESTYDRV